MLLGLFEHYQKSEVHHLIRDLNPQNPMIIKRKALQRIFNMIRSNSELKNHKLRRYIFEEGGIPRLLEQLKSNDDTTNLTKNTFSNYWIF